jgi:uncharacterized alpha-E superfamily protein
MKKLRSILYCYNKVKTKISELEYKLKEIESEKAPIFKELETYQKEQKLKDQIEVLKKLL